FRARFQGAAPPPAQRYWRGPVLHDFDGNIWRAARGQAVGGDVQFTGPAFEYTLMLEASGRHWIYALDLPASWERPYRNRRTFDYQLLHARPLDQPVTVTLTSHTQYMAGETLSRTLRAMDTRLPPEVNPRTRQLALRLRGA